MTITPTEVPECVETSDSTELLIKEARVNTRRRRSRWLLVFIVIAALTSLTIAYFSSRAPGSPSPSVLTKSKTSSIVVPECTTPNLRILDRGTSVATGHWIQLFQLTNLSGRACSISGFPKISLETSKGMARSLVVTNFKSEQSINIGDTHRGPIPVADLAAHGGMASFWIAGSDFPAHDAPACDFATKVIFKLSGAKSTLIYDVVRIPFHYCQNVLEVTPVLSGPSGSDPGQKLAPFALMK
jgi:hypothetical protein